MLNILLVQDFLLGILASLPLSLFSNETTIKKNNFVTTIAQLPKAYNISFSFKANSYLSGFASILHITLGGDKERYGDRAPGIWFVYDKIHINNAISGNKDYKITVPRDVPRNTWVSVIVSQQLEPATTPDAATTGSTGSGERYVYRVHVDGTLVDEKVNNDTRVWKDIMLYVGAPWYEPMDGTIKDLRITGKRIFPYYKDSVKCIYISRIL